MAKVVSFINMKGGVAKTTLAVNFADYISRELGKSVLLVDIDPQFNATQCFMSANDFQEHLSNDGGTILNIFDRNDSVSGDLVDGVDEIENKEDLIPLEISEKLFLVPGNLELHKIEVSAGEGTENLLKLYLNSVSSKYDIIIIDTPPTPSIWLSSSLIASNYFVIPVKPEPLSLTGIGLLNNLIAKRKRNFSLEIECAGIVMTMVETGTKVFRTFKEDIMGTPVGVKYLLKDYIPKRTSIPNDQREQRLIMDGSQEDLKTSLKNVSHEILQRMDLDDA